MYSKSIETTLGLLDDCRRLYKELKYIQFQFIIDITSQLCYFCSRVNILENRNLTYRNSQTLRTISSMVKQIFRLLHFHVRMYIYIHGTNKYLVERMALEGGLSFFRWNILRARVEFFFLKPPKSRNICLSAVARSSCRWMCACYCLTSRVCVRTQQTELNTWLRVF